MLDERLSMVCLRAVVSDLESNPGQAAAALARLLGAPVLPAEAPAAPVAHRDLKPPKPKRAPRRPAAPEDLEPQGPAAVLAAELVEAFGGVRPAARAVPTSPAMLKRWRAGYVPTDATMRRMRTALKRAARVAPAEPVVEAAPPVKARKPKGARAGRSGRRAADAPPVAPSGGRWGAKARDGELVLRDLQDAAEHVDEDQAEQAEAREATPAEVARALIERLGEPGLERVGLRASMVRKVAEGGPVTPSALNRLRNALAAAEPVAVPLEQPVEGEGADSSPDGEGLPEGDDAEQADEHVA